MANINDEDDPKEYRWETGYEKTWEAITEDGSGLLEPSIADIILKAKRKRQAQKQGRTKLGMMRHVFLLLDLSEAMNSQDLKPTRIVCTLKLLEGFIEEFFDQNPISQMGIILMQNKRADKAFDLAGNFRKHVQFFKSLSKTNLVGEPSLQNGLELAYSSLKLLPSHASKEILIIMGSLTTCDPGDINTTIDKLKQEGIKCSIIGLAAEVQVCRVLANQTKGSYNVILDDCHFKDLLYQQVEPSPASASLESSQIKMGFPHQMNTEGTEEPLTMCMCHVDSKNEGSKLTTDGYYCPQCFSKYCELPVECKACGLTLVSAPHLARSYHHLFPAANYQEIRFNKQTNHCYACQKPFGDDEKQVYECQTCKKIFCIDCDIFVHDILHTCPGCATDLTNFQITNPTQS